MNDCPNWRVDAGRTNWAKNESPKPPFSLLWKEKVSERFSPGSPLKVGTSLLFTDVAWEDGTHATLYCFDASTGELRWTFRNPVSGTTFLGGVGDETAVVYQGLGEGGILGINLKDGAVRWHIEELAASSRFGGVIQGNEIFLDTRDSQNQAGVCGIDLTTGDVLSQFKIPFFCLNEICVTPDVIYGIPQVENAATKERVARHVVALSRKTGELLWMTDVHVLDSAKYGSPAADGNGDLNALVVAEDRIFITQLSGKLWCLEAESGNPLWSYAEHHSTFYTPAYADGKLYLRKLDNFVCLDAPTGNEQYSVNHNGMTSWGAHSGTIAGDYLFFSDGCTLFAFDRNDGHECWRQSYRKKKVLVWGPPIICEGNLYVNGGDNYVYCFGSK